MGKRNLSLKTMLENIQPNELLVAASAIPSPGSVNLQGYEAYSQDKWLTLLTQLNVINFKTQYHKSVGSQISDFCRLVKECSEENPYLTAQCIVYSRCVSDGMRSTSQIAAAVLVKSSPGQEWIRRFFLLWDKKNSKGGVIFRPDDMAKIVEYSQVLSGTLPNSIKKSFKKNLECLDSYSILKYKRKLIDVINLVHPSPNVNPEHIKEIKGQKVSVITAVIKGMNLSADTWEVAQSEAGEIVAQAKREGKVSDGEAQQILDEAKTENWKSLLSEKKLGILAALRNLRSILNLNPDNDVIEMLTLLIENQRLISEGKIMPYHFDLAIESVKTLGSNQQARSILESLNRSYENSIPNLKESLKGRNLVMLDCSGSMHTPMYDARAKKAMGTSCLDKGKLLAATLAKATNADVLIFGSSSEFVNWDPSLGVFALADSLVKNMGGTDLGEAWRFAADSRKEYDRVFIISDNECNVGSTYNHYQKYVSKVGDPYVYSIDLAGYGTNAIAGPKVRYYFGYGYGLFEDLEKNEFNPEYHLEKVKKIII